MDFSCPVCGSHLSVATANLMIVFERYLFLTFLISLATRLQLYKANILFLLQFSVRWPKLLEVVKEHRTVFFAWTTLAPVTVTLVMLLAHTLSYHFVWPGAMVSVDDLSHHWLTIPLVGSLGIALLYMDARSLFSVKPVDLDTIERDLTRGEMALERRISWGVRLSTLFLVNPRRIVEKRVHVALMNLNLALIGQMRRWMIQTLCRLAFGFSLWLTWAFVAGMLGPMSYSGILLGMMAALLVVVYRLTHVTSSTEPAATTPIEPAPRHFPWPWRRASTIRQPRSPQSL